MIRRIGNLLGSRIARGGEVLIPTSPDQKIRFIDARDLAEFAITALEQELNGIYNTLGNMIAWKEWTDACRAASGSDVRLTWVEDEEFIRDNMPLNPRPFGTFPIIMPAEAAKSFGFINSDKALTAGLQYRPAIETARDILAWNKTRQLSESESAVASVTRARASIDWGNGPGNQTHWIAGITAARSSPVAKMASQMRI